jgi:hypothetical protein
VEYGAQAAGMQQLDVDGLVYLKFSGMVIGPPSGPSGRGIEKWVWSGFGLLSMLKIVRLKSLEKGLKSQPLCYQYFKSVFGNLPKYS